MIVIMPTLPDPCTLNDSALYPEDCAPNTATPLEEWLGQNIGGFRVWHLVVIALSIFLGIVIGLCCCLRFKIHYTSHAIEADKARKNLTKHFERELKKIDDNEMKKMNLKKALEQLQETLEGEEDEVVEPPLKPHAGSVRTGLRVIINGMRTKWERQDFNDVIM